MSETLTHPTQAVRKISEEEAHEIGIEAYHYLYPLVLMHITRRVSINDPLGVKPGFGPEGVFHHTRKFPAGGFNEVGWPNVDTLCSLAWLELNKDPYVLSVPDTQGRYNVLPIFDMWTDVFASVGSRTSGSCAAHFAIVPPRWNGTVPSGMERIEFPTTHVWVVAQTQTCGPKDYAAVHKIQDNYVVTPLSQWGGSPRPRAQKIDPAEDAHTTPKAQLHAMSSATFFGYAADLMAIDTPHLTDWSILSRMRRIGLEPGKHFRLKKAPVAVQAGLAAAPEEARKRMIAKPPTGARVINGWQMNTDAAGPFGNHYLKRAMVAMNHLGMLPSEDAIYPVNLATAEGTPPIGENRYVMHFRKEGLPPARAFWSATIHDREGFPARHPLNRLAIGDRDALKYDPDGSLLIHIQNEQPPADQVSNWLPSPLGPFGITMSLYWPRPEALDGGWAPPLLQRVSD